MECLKLIYNFLGPTSLMKGVELQPLNQGGESALLNQGGMGCEGRAHAKAAVLSETRHLLLAPFFGDNFSVSLGGSQASHRHLGNSMGCYRTRDRLPLHEGGEDAPP